MLSKPQATLLAFLALSSFTQASWLDDTVDDLVRRQGTEDAAGARPTIESVVPPVTTSSTLPTVITDSSSTSIVPTPTGSPSPTSTTPPTTSSVPPTTSSSISSTTPSSSSSELPTTSSTIVEPTPTPSSSIPTTTPTPPASTQSQTVIRITKTETVDGQVRTSISESTSMSPVVTDPASLNQSKETNGSSMSPKTRSTIIGVVVGLGGAVLLGGLAVVAYRIWGRKKGREEADDFYDHKRPDTMEKAGGSSGSGSSNPFKSTLENYHNPAKVNASSNF